MRVALYAHILSFSAFFGASIALIALGAASGDAGAPETASTIVWRVLTPTAILAMLTGGVLAAEGVGGRPWLGAHVAAATAAIGSAIIGSGWALNPASGASALTIYGAVTAALALVAMTIARWRALRRPTRR